MGLWLALWRLHRQWSCHFAYFVINADITSKIYWPLMIVGDAFISDMFWMMITTGIVKHQGFILAIDFISAAPYWHYFNAFYAISSAHASLISTVVFRSSPRVKSTTLGHDFWWWRRYCALWVYDNINAAFTSLWRWGATISTHAAVLFSVKYW